MKRSFLMSFQQDTGSILTIYPVQGEDNLKTRRTQGEAYVKEC